MQSRRQRSLLIAAALLAALPAAARTLVVGPGEAFAAPADAARAVQDGDAVLIRAGTYYGCASWRANGITVAGEGPDTALSDVGCEGKAAFVVSGNDVTVRDLSLTRVRVPDGNGAGIRAEGRNLQVERVRFVNNQRGIVAGDQPGSTLRVLSCEFAAIGTPDDPRSSPAIAAGALDRLEVRDSIFRDPRAGNAVSSAAAYTVIAGNRVAAAGNPPVIQLSAAAEVSANRFELTAAEGQRAAILLTGSGAAAIRDNRLVNAGDPAVLVLDWRDGAPTVANNTVPQADTELSTSGALIHAAKTTARSGVDAARGLLGMAKRQLKAAIGR